MGRGREGGGERERRGGDGVGGEGRGGAGGGGKDKGSNVGTHRVQGMPLELLR